MNPDDRLDDVLHEAIRQASDTPPVPRDEMWAQIEAQRRERRKVIVVAPHRWRRVAWPVAAAAVLVVGIAIGRWVAPPAPQPGPTAPPAVAVGAPAAYRFAALEHFTRSEVLLTQFAVQDAGSQHEDATTLAQWATGLLQDTRLLLDSPAAADADVRGLLEDLELVLVQMVQATARDSQARDWISDAARRQDVVERLRRVPPVPPARAGTRGVL